MRDAASGPTGLEIGVVRRKLREITMTLTRTRWRLCLGLAVIGLCLLLGNQRANALITGGEGNDPVHDPGWAEGAAAVFDAEGRIAYWVGPPFGGGQWHAECRGDAAAFNKLLADFAKIKAESRKLIIHDGIGRSVWLNINNVPEKREAAQIDWSFTVWQLENWKRLQALPARFRAPDSGDGDVPPAPVIDVYVGFNINWADVRVPEGIDVVDERLEAHGFSVEDGTVLEGDVNGAAGSPLAATAHLERIERRDGKHHYERVRGVDADETGHWAMTSVPAGWFRVVVEAPEHVSRIAGYQQLDGSPHWASMPTTLAKGGTVSGTVRDQAGVPLADVTVRLDDVIVGKEEVYRTSNDFKLTTDATGKFEFQNVPLGQTSIHVHKAGYVRPGLGPNIESPAANVDLTMQPAAHARVVVDFGKQQRPDAYLVEMEPEGGNVVGSYGGSANLPDSNTYEFRNVPAGTYVFFGRPNPGSTDEETDRVTVELRGGETTAVELKAK